MKRSDTLSCSELIALATVIRAGMQQLSECERVTLILADMHGLSYEAIARRMRVPNETVQARLSQARRSLRDYLLAHQEKVPVGYRFTARACMTLPSQATTSAKPASK